MKETIQRPKYGGGDPVVTRLYNIWTDMKQRCYNPNAKNYNRYGGRGIKVFSEWKDSFEKFKNWALENGYQNSLTLDRLDNNSGYCPANCRWATAKQQSHNRANTILCNGVCIKTVAEENDAGYESLLKRYKRYGADIAVSTIQDIKDGCCPRKILYKGHCIGWWLKKIGIKRSTFNNRYYRHKWSIEKCILTPVREYKKCPKISKQ